MRTLAVVGLALFILIPIPHAWAGLIVNGDFEAGNAGFTSDYLFANGLGIGGQQTYDIITNPSLHHPSGANYGDHTTGAGLMMAVNESVLPNVLIWSETVAVPADTTFTFSAWISSWTPSVPAELNIIFNGVSIGTMTAPATTGVWTQFSLSWDSGAATSAVIELHNINTSDVGGDFALDDLSLIGPSTAPVPEPTSIVITLIGAGLGGVWSLIRRKRAVY